MTLQTEFKKWQRNHHNPFTPKLVDIKQANGNIVELAKSRRKEFYGIAVWTKKNNNCEVCKESREPHPRFEALSHDLAKSFHDEDEARTYFRMIHSKVAAYEEIEDILKEVEEQ